MRFEEAYEGWNGGRLTQSEAAQILGTRSDSYPVGITFPVQTQTPLDKAFPTHLTVVSSMMNKKNVRHSPGYGGCARRS